MSNRRVQNMLKSEIHLFKGFSLPFQCDEYDETLDQSSVFLGRCFQEAGQGACPSRSSRSTQQLLHSGASKGLAHRP